jgi:hypothetical protein
MGNKQPSMKKNTFLLIISLLVILTYPALYLLRHLDDNRLTSWEWVFQEGRAPNVFVVLVTGVVLAFILSRIRISLRWPGTFLLFVSFAVGALFWGEPEVIVDASRYFTAAKHLEIYGIGYFIREWGRGISAWTDMPLFPFLYGLIFKFCGEARIYIQIFTTLLFSLSALLTYLIGKELWNKEAGFYGGLLLLGMPYLLTQVPLMLVDVPTMFFLLLSVYSFIFALKRGGSTIVFPIIAIPLTFYSKYSSWLMLSVLAVIFFVFAAEEKKTGGGRNFYFRAFLIVLISGLLIGIVFFYKAELFFAQMRLLVEYQKPGLGRWSESFVSTFFFQINPLISLAAMYSLFEAGRKRDLKYVIVLWLVLLVIVLQIKRIRYIIMVFPMLGLMASYGILQISDREIRRFILLCILVFSFSVALFAYLPFIEKISSVNLKEAGKLLDSLPEASVRVYTILPGSAVVNPAVAVPILDFYTKKHILYDYDIDISSVQREEIERSSLRFTWEFINPHYYMNGKYAKDDTAVVVVSNDPSDTLPAKIEENIKDCRLAKVFAVYEGLFQYRTSVRIYRCGVMKD